MRLNEKKSQGPSALVGVVLFVVLLLVVQSVRDQNTNRPLTQQFAAQPTPALPAPGTGKGLGLVLPPLPTDVIGFAQTALSKLNTGQRAAALTPVAGNPAAKVEISGLATQGSGLRITGQITNVGQAPLAVSLSAFRFKDESGIEYAAQSGASTTLAPGQKAPLDLTLPIQNPRQLTLEVALPNQPPIMMTLLQS